MGRSAADHVDAAVTQSAVCTLSSLTDSEAIVAFEGTTEGAVMGSATKITLTGELTFDRRAQLIRSFKAVQSEKREPGPFSPGLMQSDNHMDSGNFTCSRQPAGNDAGHCTG